ncbi:DUF461 domain-containing protein [Streptomyces sp. CBMA152]|uniref:DUF461 domain-containing protein n=1 Tax=Streptomyces sp. CBMA152 TaxID=1896312 RepID=UPI001660FDD9|nr:DUF461 domain-containing protein [Streptomyces sp. CBMA152]MBD0746225.1 DUF461 domain-containing protein [Streptomyces sp. CBMA152]
MSRSLRRGALAASAIAFSLASLAACSAGNDAQTLEVKPDNAAVKVGDIKIQNASVLTQPKADAPGPAVITATIFNNGDKAQTLDAVKLSASGAAVKLSPAKGQSALTVPAHGSLLIGGKDNASAVIENGKEAAKNGDAQPVTFQLSTAGEVTLRAYVIPATSYFEGYGPSELPKPPAATPGAPGATTTPGATESGKPSGKPSGTPAKGGKPSGTPTTGAGH